MELKELLKILQSISQDEIEKLKVNPKNKQWSERVWYNGKRYQRSSFRSASEPAIDFYNNNVEIPNQRKVFYINQNSRFGLPDVEIAYFASNIVLTTYETIEFFRGNPNLTWENEGESYWEARSDPHPESTKHDVKYKIQPGIKLLDLTRGGSLVRLIEQSLPGFVQTVINNRNTAIYSQTKALAKWAFDKAFDGIIYHPVRNTTDVRCGGKCLVILRKDKTYPRN